MLQKADLTQKYLMYHKGDKVLKSLFTAPPQKRSQPSQLNSSRAGF